MNRVLFYNPERKVLPVLSGNLTAFSKYDLPTALATAETFYISSVVVITTPERERKERAISSLRRKTNAPIIVWCDPNEAEFFYSAGADNLLLVDNELIFNMNLKASLKLYERLSGLKETDSVELDNFYISLAEYVLKINGEEIHLPRKELELLFFLSKNIGRVFTRNELLDEVWGVDFASDPRTVDVHIRRLRKKLEGSGYSVKTVFRVGYGFFYEN
jgi:DNA-binding response OmpR family regulator